MRCEGRFENPPKEIVKRKEEWPKEYSELAFDKIIWYHSKQSKLHELGHRLGHRLRHRLGHRLGHRLRQRLGHG